jgi:3-hydroxyacyl-CoA dehydrogenase/enoyl-CoA hydratase/3-hydroxybutyryl-CoA epimerase
MIKYEISPRSIALITIEWPNGPLHFSGEKFLAEFQIALARLSADQRSGTVKGILLHLGKNAENRPFEDRSAALPTDADPFFLQIKKLNSSFRQLEKSNLPIAAALSGDGWGGGLEAALAAHRIFALDRPGPRFGFPETTLGQAPIAGGSVRLLWMLGLEKSFPLLAEGRLLTANEALATGLLHELCPDGEKMLERAEQWLLETTAADKPCDTGGRIPGGGLENPRTAQWVAGANAALAQKTRGLYPAPQALLNTLAESSTVDFDTALRIAGRYAVSLALGRTGRNLSEAFWNDLNALESGAQRPSEVPSSPTRRLGIIGAGMMGAGIACAAAEAGIPVTLQDRTMDQAEKGKERTARWLSKKIEKKESDESHAQSVLARIRPTDTAADLAGCDLVVEAVYENRSLKNEVVRETEKYLPENAVFSSNTSTLPITGLAEASRRPENFVGIHFFSPVEKMRLVEIIRGQKTAPETLAKALDFVRQIGKTPIVVNDGRGFYTSRVFGKYVMEGIALMAEGQPAALIENAGLASGMPTPPLALTDEVSLTLLLDVEKQTAHDLGPAYLPHPALAVLEKMVGELHRPGKSKGGGFYSYPEGGKKSLWSDLAQHFPTGAPLPLRDLVDRLLFVQVLETRRCFREGVIADEAAANIGSIFGWGFAPHTGGTVRFVRSYGESAFRDRCAELAELYGERFVFSE